MGFLGSSYSAADALLTPPQINVVAGDSIDSVTNAVSGVAFYTDMIGFGGSSSSLTAGMPLAPLGINYFLNTGQTCSNGATMYQYFEGIPTGNALGAKIGKALAKQNMPLKGLAPGMIEDAQSALNPMPLLNAMLGSGYPKCRLLTAQVGDMKGRIADPDTGTPWIEDPQTAFRRDGLMYQRRWVVDLDANGNAITLIKDQWDKTPKTMNKDGTPKVKESFDSGMLMTASTAAVVSILLLIGYGLMSSRARR